MNLFYLFYLLAPAISLALMCSPNSILMTFTPDPDTIYFEHYSYYSNVPMGYGNYFPILIMSTTILLIVVLLTFIILKKKIPNRICLIFSAIPFILSIIHLILYFVDLTYYGFFIALFSLFEIILLLPIANKRRRN